MISAFSFHRRLSDSRPRVDWVKMSDAELILAARIGDRAGKEAFVEIVRRHQMAVCSVACSVTGRIGLTDDIAQKAFLNAWKGIATLREPAKLKAWLMRIVHDCAVRAVRRERPHASLDDEAVSLAEAPGAGPDQAMADIEEERFVWSALAGLPENLRTPLVLFYCEGQSVAAVAAALDLSGDAVKQRLFRGRNELRSQVAAMLAVKMESRLERVLGQVRPPALLVVTVAAGLGLLSTPTVVAGSAFTAAAKASSTTVAATMSTSKTSLAIAALLAAAALPFGYGARMGMESSPAVEAVQALSIPQENKDKLLTRLQLR